MSANKPGIGSEVFEIATLNFEEEKNVSSRPYC